MYGFIDCVPEFDGRPTRTVDVHIGSAATLIPRYLPDGTTAVVVGYYDTSAAEVIVTATDNKDGTYTALFPASGFASAFASTYFVRATVAGAVHVVAMGTFRCIVNPGDRPSATGSFFKFISKVDALPSKSVLGYTYSLNGTLYWWNGTGWSQFGKSYDFSGVAPLDPDSATPDSTVAKFNELLAILKG